MSQTTTTVCDRCSTTTSSLGRVGGGWLTGTIYEYGRTPRKIDLCPDCTSRAIRSDDRVGPGECSRPSCGLPAGHYGMHQSSDLESVAQVITLPTWRASREAVAS